jgi:hypothetical protein
MTLKAETDAAVCVLRGRRARRQRTHTGHSALAGPTAREFLRRLARSGQRIDSTSEPGALSRQPNQREILGEH